MKSSRVSGSVSSRVGIAFSPDGKQIALSGMASAAKATRPGTIRSVSS